MCFYQFLWEQEERDKYMLLVNVLRFRNIYVECGGMVKGMRGKNGSLVLNGIIIFINYIIAISYSIIFHDERLIVVNSFLFIIGIAILGVCNYFRFDLSKRISNKIFKIILILNVFFVIVCERTGSNNVLAGVFLFLYLFWGISVLEFCKDMDIKKRIEFICLAFLGLMCLGFDNKKAMVMATVLGLLSAYFLMDSSAKKILLILGCLVITVGLFFYLSVLVLGEEYQRERVQSCISIEKDIRIENVQKNAANIICNAKIINNDLQHEIIKEIGKSYYWAYLAGIGGLFVVAAIIAIYIIWFYRCVIKNVHTVHAKIFLVIFFVRMIYAIMMNLDAVPPTSLSLPLTFNEPILFIYDCLVVSFFQNAYQNVEE